MWQTYTEKPPTFPFLFETGDPDPPGGTGDPPPPGIKPPTSQQPGSTDQADIKPPTATGSPDAEPPDTADANPPIIISGGNS